MPDTDIKTEDEKAGLDFLGDAMGEMAPAEFEDKAKPPAASDASPEAAPEAADTPAPDPRDEPPAEAKPAEEPKAKEEDVDDGPSEEEELAALAGPLTHDDVKGSPSFQGVLGELTATRAELKASRDRVAELEANGAGKPTPGEADPHDDLFEEEEDDGDIDYMTKGERKAVLAEAIQKAVAKALTPIQAERERGNRLSYVQDDIAAMRADPAIPDGVKLSRICIDARKHMAKHSPKLLEQIDGQKGMSRELYNYGVLRVPAVQAAVSKARTTQDADTRQRAVRGQSATDTPKEFFEMLGYEDGDDVPDPTE